MMVECFDSKGNYLGNLDLWTDLSKKKIFFRMRGIESGVIGVAEIKLQSSEQKVSEVVED